MSHIEASSLIKYLINLKAHIPNYVFMRSKSLSSLLIISASLSLAAAAIIPIYHEASAKECDGSSCSDKQDSNSNSNSNDDHHNNEHSNSDDINGDDDGGNNAKQQKDKTPFVLS